MMENTNRAMIKIQLNKTLGLLGQFIDFNKLSNDDKGELNESLKALVQIGSLATSNEMASIANQVYESI